MPTLDRLGRRRQPGQHRGLRPLFPALPPDCQSRLMRVAMSAAAWARLDALIAGSTAPTPPRAVGVLIEGWLSASAAHAAAFSTVSAPVPETATDWQVWQMRKERALLASVLPRYAGDLPALH